MTRISFGTVALLFSAGLAGAAVGQGRYADVQLNWAVAESSGMSVDYPAGLFTVDAGPSDKGPGRALRSADGSAGFMYYVQANEKRDTPGSFLRSRLSAPHTKIDYRRVTDRFIAVSGVREGRIYYSRCNFPGRERTYSLHGAGLQREREAALGPRCNTSQPFAPVGGQDGSAILTAAAIRRSRLSRPRIVK